VQLGLLVGVVQGGRCGERALGRWRGGRNVGFDILLGIRLGWGGRVGRVPDESVLANGVGRAKVILLNSFELTLASLNPDESIHQLTL
jgi:hypothetical protein